MNQHESTVDLDKKINSISMEKELKNKITGLKKQKGAVSKEAKKELEKQIEQLEKELKELKLLKNKQQNDQNQESNNDQETHQETHQEISALEMEASTAVKQSKGKKRKNKKMQELEAMRKEAEEEAKSMPNYKEQEDIALDTLANDMSRKIVPVPADGNCLYYAISRQLQLVGAETAYTFKQLRGLAASWMKDHPDDFLPFLLNKQGDMLSQGKSCLI